LAGVVAGIDPAQDAGVSDVVGGSPAANGPRVPAGGQRQASEAGPLPPHAARDRPQHRILGTTKAVTIRVRR
jgi:hypothetical protein